MSCAGMESDFEEMGSKDAQKEVPWDAAAFLRMDGHTEAEVEAYKRGFVRGSLLRRQGQKFLQGQR